MNSDTLLPADALPTAPPPVHRCRSCDRPIRDPISISRETGPGCWAKDHPDAQPGPARSTAGVGEPDLIDEIGAGMELPDAEGIADVRRLLRKSARSAAAGRRAIRQAIRLRRAALDLVPVGTVLRFDVGRPDFVFTFRREPTTKWTSLDGAFDDGTVGDEWIEEQWMSGNLTVQDATTTEETQ